MTLPALAGGTFSLADARRTGWVLLAFFKLDCQTCLFSMPYWDRLFIGHAGEGFRLWGVALDAERDVEAFTEKSGVEFPVALDGRIPDDRPVRPGLHPGALPGGRGRDHRREPRRL